MVHETPSPSSSSLSPTDDEKNALLKEGVIHTAADDDRGERGGEATARGERLGPGCFQLCRFDPSHDLALAWKWPREYTLRFKVSRDVFLLGAGITETDRQFYSPNVRLQESWSCCSFPLPLLMLRLLLWQLFTSLMSFFFQGPVHADDQGSGR